MKGCIDAHGIEGLNRLNDVLRPYLDLRSFYFGARAVLYRICVPRSESDTSYLQMREIELKREGEVISVQYAPLRKKQIRRISYSANTQSPLLEPFKSPRKGGDEELKGFFNKKAYCPSICLFEDLIKSFESAAGDFEPLKISCGKGASGVLRREVGDDRGRLTHTYVFLHRDLLGKESPSEKINFVLNKPR